MAAMEVGIVYHPDHVKHITGSWHPERAERLTYVLEKLQADELYRDLKPILPEKIETRWIQEIHSPEYIDLLQRLKDIDDIRYLDPDTAVCNDSYEAARLAAGAVISGIDRVMSGEIDSCFCAVRPPGHHAEKGMSKGFCLLNNVAIGAGYLKANYGMERVAIVDWDVHHGNGTQHIFYSDPEVYYISLHQYPFYPGTGAAGETGSGKGINTTLNIPMLAGSEDKDYLEAFASKVIPALEGYRPEFIMISTGFDAHRDDPLASINLTDDSFYQFTLRVREIASGFSNDRIVSVLEGGYNPGALYRSIKKHLRALAE